MQKRSFGHNSRGQAATMYTFRNRNGEYRNYRATGEHTVNLTITMA